MGSEGGCAGAGAAGSTGAWCLFPSMKWRGTRVRPASWLPALSQMKIRRRPLHGMTGRIHKNEQWLAACLYASSLSLVPAFTPHCFHNADRHGIMHPRLSDSSRGGSGETARSLKLVRKPTHKQRDLYTTTHQPTQHQLDITFTRPQPPVSLPHPFQPHTLLPTPRIVTPLETAHPPRLAVHRSQNESSVPDSLPTQ